MSANARKRFSYHHIKYSIVTLLKQSPARFARLGKILIRQRAAVGAGHGHGGGQFGVEHRELLPQRLRDVFAALRLAPAGEHQRRAAMLFNRRLHAVGKTQRIIALKAVKDRFQRRGEAAVVNGRGKHDKVRRFKVAVKPVEVALHAADPAVAPTAPQTGSGVEAVGVVFRHRRVSRLLFEQRPRQRCRAGISARRTVDDQNVLHGNPLPRPL